MSPLRRYLSDNASFLAAGALLTFLSSFGQTFFISVFAGEIRAKFGLGHGEWGLIYSLGTTASAIVMIWAGALTDRIRVRVLGPVVLTGLALACLSMAVNPVIWALPLVIFALRFFGQGMTSHIAVVAMVRWFQATRGRALAIAGLGFSAGEALLPIMFVTLMGFIDWRWLWVAAALLIMAGAPGLMRLLRQERTPQSMAEDMTSLGMGQRHWTRMQALHNPVFWCLLPALLGPPAFNTAFFFHQVHYAEVTGWTHAQLVALFPIYTGTAVAMMVASGWALDRWGSLRLLPLVELPMAFGFVLFSFDGSPQAVLAGFILLGIGAGAFGTLPNAFWAESYGTAHIGAIKALAAAVMVFGSAIGPAITGVLIDRGFALTDQYFVIAGYFAFASFGLVVATQLVRRALEPSAV